jgi:hypothetical protein
MDVTISSSLKFRIIIFNQYFYALEINCVFVATCLVNFARGCHRNARCGGAGIRDRKPLQREADYCTNFYNLEGYSYSLGVKVTALL